jgi:hypothetical protein
LKAGFEVRGERFGEFTPDPAPLTPDLDPEMVRGERFGEFTPDPAPLTPDLEP